MNCHIMEKWAAEKTVAQLTQAETELNNSKRWSYTVQDMPQGKACIMVTDETGKEVGKL